MWLLFSQISALAETATTLLAKKEMKKYDSTVVTWVWVTTSQAFLFLLLLLNGIPTIQPIFLTVFIARIVLDTVALLLFTKALHLEDISLITPLFNFSAIFSLFFSFLINGEVPSFWGIVGVFLIVSGAYLLHFEAGARGVFAPVTRILKSRASLMMLASTLLYGVIFSISKVGIEASSLTFYTYVSALGLSVTLFPIALRSNKKDLLTIIKPQNLIRVLPLGIIDGVKILALMATIQTSYVSFADASNNTSILYNQFFAKLFFKEQINSRLLPTLIMFGGLGCIVLFG